MPCFSLIVPVYKVEEYLPKCVESIRAQSCQDYELLLVDDGSPDRCPALCDAYAAQDPAHIRVIHQPNAGPGAARNRGIDEAAGDYIVFVDSDDYLSPETLEELRRAIGQTGADLYHFGAFVERNGRVIGQVREQVPVNHVTDLRQAPRYFFGTMAPWGKAYRRALFSDKSLRYPPQVRYEDIRLSVKLLARCERIVSLEGTYYHYLQREDSAMRNRNADRNAELLTAFDDILAWYRENGLFDEFRDELCALAVEHILLSATVRVLLIDPHHRLIGEFRSYVEREFPDYASNRYVAELPRARALAFRLLQKRRYGTVRLLFGLKERLGK